MRRPFDITKAQAFIVIIRAQHTSGQVQSEALAELKRRGLWLPKAEA